MSNFPTDAEREAVLLAVDESTAALGIGYMETPAVQAATNAALAALAEHVAAREAAAEKRGRAARVRELEAERDALRAALVDMAEHGLRCDLTPTVRGEGTYVWWSAYLAQADEMVRNRARAALGGRWADAEGDADD